MKIHLRLAAILIVLIFGAMNFVSAEEIIRELSTRKLENILESLADTEIISDVQEMDSADSYAFQSGGVKILLINNKENLLLYTSFSKDTVISLSKINEWNRNHYFTRAYLNKNRDPVLEADLLIDGGVSEKRIQVWLAVYCLSVREYLEYLNED